MRAVLQRVSRASVAFEGDAGKDIGHGLLVLLGIGAGDGEQDVQWMVRKMVNMRIFDDPEGNMNLSVKDVDGSILLVSQFTLHASTRKGNRPSYMRSAAPESAMPLYKKTRELLRAELGKPVPTGKFGAHMEVELVNDGPVTIWLDSKNKE